MGENIDRVVSTIAELIESNLMKLAEQKTKAENSPKRPQSNKDNTAGVAALDDSIPRPSMMLQSGRGEDDPNISADRDNASDSMEEID